MFFVFCGVSGCELLMESERLSEKMIKNKYFLSTIL